MSYKLHALAFLLLGLLLLVQTAAGMTELGIVDPGAYYAPNQSLEMSITIRHDEFIPQDSELRLYLNSIPEETIDLGTYLHEESYYTYKPHTFSYNITADGENAWEDYPDVGFSYALTATGYSGTDCDEYWSLPIYNYDGVANAENGLEPIRNGSMSISLPLENCPENTTWSVQTAEENVNVTMREVCGGSFYDGHVTDISGWIYRELSVGNCDEIPATADRECWIHRFDNASLEENYRAYGGPTGWEQGGVFKDGTYQEWGQAKWDGKLGYLRINSYDYLSTYYMVYLPPNGPMVCAYTDHKEDESEQWSRSKIIDVSAGYGNPYQRQWSESELESTLNFPDCPCTGCNCSQTVSQYSVEEYQDPDDAITPAFDEPTLTVTGTCNLMDFIQNYTETVDLADYIETPGTPDSYELSVRLFHNGNEIADKSHQFHVCDDVDGDGHCEELGDCDDTDPLINPNALEICDYKDNDCNGETDEDFYGEGFECVLGKSCNDWEGSICNGTCTCTQDGLNVTCDSTYSPGELDELCLDGVDNDCDGVVDEVFDLINGSEVEACLWRCTEGSKKPCGKNVGFCTIGERTCINGSWGACIGARYPRNETCNLVLNAVPRYADDDCDGVIDNVYGGESIEETKCQCYGGNQPKPEECNGIDDDCDGDIDEKACTCSEGDTRYCGNDRGICEQGIQSCVDGYWETECHGGVGPDPNGEICYNNIDDDCDGETDEDCETGVTCRNRVWDLNEEGVDCGGGCPNPCEYPLPWIVISIIVIVFIIIFIALEISGKISV